MLTRRTLIKVLQGLVLLPLGLALGVASCVRFVEPGTFICHQSSDCASGQKCVGSNCVAADYCEYLGDCAADQACTDNRCQAADCTAANASACGNFACAVEERRCFTQCVDSSACQSGTVCHAGSCVDPASIPPPGLGESCESKMKCATGECCAVGSGFVCATQCPTRGCSVDLDCVGASASHCCPQPDSNNYSCQKDACQPGAAGDACVNSVYCEPLECLGGHCKEPPKPLGEACDTNDQCKSQLCCAVAATGQKACADAGNSINPTCPQLFGDYCTGFCEPEGLCFTRHGFGVDGFCTDACPASGCGYSSAGRKNVCVGFTPGSSPPTACYPSCDSDADCEAVQQDLRCIGLSGTTKYCDWD